MNKQPLLSVEDLRVSFFTPAGEVKAVGGISYQLEQGEVMGIVGESGSGKSVEAFSIMGLLQSPGEVIGGEIRYNGENILDYDEKQMEDLRGNKISMIFQNPMTSLNPVYTIGNQLMEAVLNHNAITDIDIKRYLVHSLRDEAVKKERHWERKYERLETAVAEASKEEKATAQKAFEDYSAKIKKREESRNKKFEEFNYENFNIEMLSGISSDQINSIDLDKISLEALKELNPKYSKRAIARHMSINMLDLVGINNPERRIKQYPHELSGGMRQRVMIAMGLICQPDILIADEPTTALDVTIQAQIIELMKELQKRTGMAIIFITHNLGVVAEICDRVSVMYAGEIVEEASVDNIFYNPQHPYTKGLLRSMPRVDAETYERLIPIEGTPVDMLEPPAGCHFAPRCEHCMKICLQHSPGYSLVEDDHRAACWLLQMDDILEGKEPVVRPEFQRAGAKDE